MEQDRVHFDRWVSELRSELWSYARRLLGSAADADDAIQEALGRAWEAMHRGRRPENERAWLYTIVHREVLRVVNRRRGLRRLLERIRGETSETHEPRDSQAAALAAKLPYPQSAILLLRFVHDFSFGEIAEILDLPGGTVRSHATRGLERLREKISQEKP